MGYISVVGIGPGDYDNMTVKADRALQDCDVIIGYHVYVDLVKERYPGKEYLTTPMTKESDRCRLAVDFGDWFGGDDFVGFIRLNLATNPERCIRAAEALGDALSAL